MKTISTPQDSPKLASATIAIIGLGLVGGSLALALRGHCAGLIGCDRDPAVVEMALDRAVVDAASTDGTNLLANADLILLAVPVRSSLAWIARLPEAIPGQAVLLDVGSTKKNVVEAMQALPDRFDPLGGHPMCGKEEGSFHNADERLFQNAPFALTPLARTTPHARRIAVDLVSLLGARPIWIDAATHDEWVAATSHLPHLLSTALMLCTPGETAPLAGPGFRSTSRLAAGSAEMKTDLFATNKIPVLKALARFRGQLDIIENALKAGDLDTLQEQLAHGAALRQTFYTENP